jgi:hypothetical protein
VLRSTASSSARANAIRVEIDSLKVPCCLSDRNVDLVQGRHRRGVAHGAAARRFQPDGPAAVIRDLELSAIVAKGPQRASASHCIDHRFVRSELGGRLGLPCQREIGRRSENRMAAARDAPKGSARSSSPTRASPSFQTGCLRPRSRIERSRPCLRVGNCPRSISGLCSRPAARPAVPRALMWWHHRWLDSL